MNKYLSTSGLLALTALIAPQALLAVTADDVVCAGCVDGPDIANKAVNVAKLAPNSVITGKIANGAVTTEKIAPDSIGELKLKNYSVSTDKLQNQAVTTQKLADSSVGEIKLINGAVSNAKIQNEAVTYDKLASDLKTAIGTTVAYDHRDYSGTNVVQQVFALSGTGLGNCNGAGTPDTEVWEPVITDMGSYIMVDSTRWQYTGGTGGTACKKEIQHFINDTVGHKFVGLERYAADGITLVRNVETTYDPVNAPLDGLKLRTTDMKVGATFGSAGLTTETVGATDGAYDTHSALKDVDVTHTIDPGGPNEETFTDCIRIHEMRISTHLGNATARTRTFCAGVGLVKMQRVDPDGTFQYWDLVGYTTL